MQTNFFDSFDKSYLPGEVSWSNVYSPWDFFPSTRILPSKAISSFLDSAPVLESLVVRPPGLILQNNKRSLFTFYQLPELERKSLNEIIALNDC